ncbi:hypothetical protein B0H10DRAFT_915212 [Mycena sp. CBHHK59/15]|nr:hypothetical protein B0H10DRAFT_915212 [Mycena sp. CBHHK59/15]
MATPQTSQASPHSKTFVVKQHRTIMACTNCRRRKIRCLTSEQPPINPCARCTKKNFQCEYVAVTHQSLTSSSPSANQSPEILPSNLSDTSGVTEPQHASQSQDVDRFFQALDAPLLSPSPNYPLSYPASGPGPQDLQPPHHRSQNRDFIPGYPPFASRDVPQYQMCIAQAPMAHCSSAGQSFYNTPRDAYHDHCSWSY